MNSGNEGSRACNDVAGNICQAREYGRYFPRLAFLSLMSVVNTVGSVADWLLYGRAIAAQPLNPDPVFILGHPRTGGVATLHVHQSCTQTLSISAWKSIFRNWAPCTLPNISLDG